MCEHVFVDVSESESQQSKIDNTMAAPLSQQFHQIKAQATNNKNSFSQSERKCSAGVTYGCGVHNIFPLQQMEG